MEKTESTSMRANAIMLENIVRAVSLKLQHGKKLVYVPIHGDPERTRNFAGLWVWKTRHFAGARLVGRWLGHNIDHGDVHGETVRQVIERNLTIWDSYRYPAPEPSD